MAALWYQQATYAAVWSTEYGSISMNLYNYRGRLETLDEKVQRAIDRADPLYDMFRAQSGELTTMRYAIGKMHKCH